MTTTPYGDHLPYFPMLAVPITEERIERAVEQLFNRADAALMAGKATQEQYASWARDVNAWSNRQYASAAAHANLRWRTDNHGRLYYETA